MGIIVKKTYKLLVNLGKIFFIWFLLFIISISINSFTIKGKANYGNRCNNSMNLSIFDNYKYKSINLISRYSECNTTYLEYESELNENDNIVFLVSLSKLLIDKNFNSDIHIIIRCREYQIIATIVDYRVSYIKSLI